MPSENPSLTEQTLDVMEQRAQRLLGAGHEVYPDQNAVTILVLIEEVRRLREQAAVGDNQG